MNAGFNAATDQNDNWRTPEWLYKALDTEFAFEFDAAADADSAKCALYSNDIERIGPPTPHTRVFCNPPYSNILPFVIRALQHKGPWVFILPVRTRALWFEMLVQGERNGLVEMRWLRKRIPFVPPVGVAESSPRMDTFIAVVRGR